MAESIFDIFGGKSQTRVQQETFTPLKTGSHSLKGSEAENVRVRGKSAIEHRTSKKALGDVGNTLKKNKTFKVRQLDPSCNQENTVLREPFIKSAQKLKSNETPNIKPKLRTPLSDICIKPKVQDQHQKQNTQTSDIRSSFLREMDNILNGVYNDGSFWEMDRYPKDTEDDYGDITYWLDPSEDIPVNFEENLEKNSKVESDLELAVEPDYLQLDFFGSVIDLEEPLPVPVLSEDEI